MPMSNVETFRPNWFEDEPNPKFEQVWRSVGLAAVVALAAGLRLWRSARMAMVTCTTPLPSEAC